MLERNELRLRKLYAWPWYHGLFPIYSRVAFCHNNTVGLGSNLTVSVIFYHRPGVHILIYSESTCICICTYLSK